MTFGLRPYSEYKHADIPWLGPIPAHWVVRRNGRLFAQRNETGFGSLPILEVSLRTGVHVRDMDNGKRKQVMSDREKYKRAVEGDIAYNMMRMWQGAVGVVPTDGLVSPAYVVARPYPDTDSRYFAYLFRTANYKSEIDAFSRGIVKDRNRLYWEDFKRMPTCVPAQDEQRTISNYLDTNGAIVRRFIRNRRRLIEVLNEQKQAIVDKVVASEQWATRRLRTVAELRVSNVDKHSKPGELPVRLCNYTDAYKNPVITADMPFMVATATAEEIAAFRLEVGDVIITKDSEDWKDIGVPALVTQSADDLVCGYHLAILRPKPTMVSGQFLAYALRSACVVTQFSIAANGVTRYGLSHGAIKAVVLPIPPREEQDAIVQHFDNATVSLNTAIKQAARKIELIQEYRTRLIADVVTGKVDVRGFVPTGLASTSEPIDDVMEEEGELDYDGEIGASEAQALEAEA